MAYISYNKLRKSEFNNIASKKDKVQDMNINLEVHDTYKKDGEKKTNFQPFNDEDVINKDYLDEKAFKKTVTYQY